MKSVLIVGAGGREHAIAWKLSTSKCVSRIIIAPGNSGMGDNYEYWVFDSTKKEPEFIRLAKKAKEENIDLIIIGPDNPLSDGIVDVFKIYGLSVFGPTASAARIESSKAFSKSLMIEAGVPTPKFFSVSSLELALDKIQSLDWINKKWVIKADGLAFGKGVKVCKNIDEALIAAKNLININNCLVIEECIFGEELSVMAFCAGEDCVLLDAAKDYKTLCDENMGPNTGGMGSYSVNNPDWNTIKISAKENVFLPALKELKKIGCEYFGVLYAGLIYDPKNLNYQVLEFNARFGDPETQAILPRMKDDLYLWCEAVATNTLHLMPNTVKFINKAAVFVVAASKGYPEKPIKGVPISISLQTTNNAVPKYFSAGIEDGKTSGGRVCGALGLGITLDEARNNAYYNLEQINFDGMCCRSDIAKVSTKNGAI